MCSRFRAWNDPNSGFAVLAARLISDIEAISLSDQEGSVEIPSYRSFNIVDPVKLQAALGRRVFKAGPQRETVDYTHRTTVPRRRSPDLGQFWRDKAFVVQGGSRPHRSTQKGYLVVRDRRGTE